MVPERVRRRVRNDFPRQTDQVIASLAELAPGESHEAAAVERIQVAALVLADKDLRRLDEAVTLGRTDWRDLLVAAGLAGEDWERRVDAELAPARAIHIWTRRSKRPSAS